ncbi:hypothetical protein HNV10_08120 [Winogradskyella litoriviva]|uniref:Transposase DDE domain-containing protein n=1 Tax=Winogradskyella litoriviva TaxID=1220182 RepID=A0ABX2E3Y4_9FLAO|nr:hypothetical protein [Winogradskyella litoriviva]NRD23203.1 hypothetical protein [Winogradskyella litoriviva]
MELVLNTTLESVSEPNEVFLFKTKGLLNSSYKSIVKENYRKATKKSIFGMRQRIKSSQYKMVNHAAAILKLSVFAMVLIAIF